MELSYKTFPRDNVNAAVTPLVFLHALGNSKEILYPMSERLSANGRKIFAVDARNHGDSPWVPEHSFPLMRDDTVNFIKQHNLDKPVLMGHSMGGKTAMLTAASNPDSISALIMEDATLKVTPFISKFKAQVEKMQQIEIPKGISLENARKKVNGLAFRLRERTDGSVAWKCSPEGMLEFMKNVTDGVQLERRIFDKPALFVFGEHSFANEPDKEDWVKANFPKAEIVVVPNAGHTVHQDNPEGFFKVVQDFLQRLDEGKLS